MGKYDIYDLLLETLGYGSDTFEITSEDLDRNTDAINKLAEKIGIALDTEDRFGLYLLNDDIHDMVEVSVAVYDLSNYFNLGFSDRKCKSIMLQAHVNGKAKIHTDSKRNVRRMKYILKKKGYNAFIKKIEPKL
jgi:ATP-dependent Clp protease adapter protein ClpS